MSGADSPTEEQTLERFFGRDNVPTSGENDTAQLRGACDAVQHFIAQELNGQLVEEPTFDELWIHFQGILTRIFGKQGATNVAPGAGGGGGSGTGGSTFGSWMFINTSHYSAFGHVCDIYKARTSGVRGGHTSSTSNRKGDPRSCCSEGMAHVLLPLLVAKPPLERTPTGSKNLFGALLEPQKVWYTFSCTSPPMPPHTVTFLRHESRPDVILLENARLYTHCLSSPPSVFPQQGGMPQLAPRFLNAEVQGAAGVVRAAPELSLSTMEFYLFSFFWARKKGLREFYDASSRPGQVTQQHSATFRPERVALAWRRYGVRGVTHRTPYLILLLDYLEAFFPHGNGVSLGGTGNNDGSNMSMQCELLLRLLVEFWLEGNTVFRPGILKEEEGKQLQLLQHQQAWGISAAAAAASAPAATRIASNFDPSVAVLWSDYTPPTDISLHGLLVASTFLLADPKLHEACRRRLACGTTAGSPGGANEAEASGGEGAAALTPALALLRPHVFGFLRVTFSPESTMHTSSATFGLAVELWMLWMRPWAAPSILKGFSPDPKSPNRPPSRPAAARRASRSGGASSSSTSSTPAARGGGGSSNQGGGLQAWASAAVSGVQDLFSNDSSRGSANSARSGTPRRGGGSSNEFSYDPWGAWVLENYSLYTTILAAFVRKAGSMSFKVHDRSSPNGRHHAAGNPVTLAQLFADTGGDNLRLLHRVAGTFSPGVTSLIASAQNTVRRSRQEGEGVAGEGERETENVGEGLKDAESEVLDAGRKALSSIQGPDLVTLESYQDFADELLSNIADLANPRVPNDWMAKGERVFFGPATDKSTERAREITNRMKTLFGLPSNWKPTCIGQGGGAQGAVAEMFHPDRDKRAPTFLSRQGKAQVASGQRACKPWDVAYVGDPMYRPQRAWEMEMLVRFWVWVSESANERWLGWTPRHDEEGEVSRRSSDSGNFEDTFDDEGPGKAIAQGKQFQRRVWREGRWANLPQRFNLRPLADLRATLGLVLATYLLRVACFYGATSGACVAGLLIALAFRLSTME
ncbi:unnamed protein product [Scytosiphon promiscuus]